jgi:alpha-beta hydrolase superfamily lysophospholipase
MTDVHSPPQRLADDNCTVRNFRGKRAVSPEAIDALSPDSQAGLRQFSLERMMGYGIDYSDAIELRSAVLAGRPWQESARTLAKTVIALAETAEPFATRASKSALFYRASALLRMSQALMLEDTVQRRDIVRGAVACHERAAALSANRRHVQIETADGPMSGWFITAQGEPNGSVIVIGGVEGWAMDFDCLGEAMASRGINALMLDAPGQGETRILHRHYLSARWLDTFRKAIDFVEQALPGRPIGIVGNSMGGGIAIAVANNDMRIRACVNNGGIIKPSLGRMAGGTFFAKMVAFCGITDENEAAAIWDTIDPVKPGPNNAYPLLVVQGGQDALVTDDHAWMFMSKVPTSGKHMEWFSDGIHCIYNHLEDRDILLADWMWARLDEAHAQRSRP